MKKIATYVVLALVSLLTLAPVIWTVLSSMRPPSESLSTDGSLIPSSLDFSSYPAVFEKVDMWLLILNSVLVTGIIAVGQMLSSAMAGYVFARFEFRSKNLLFALILATMMVPMQVTIMPVFNIKCYNFFLGTRTLKNKNICSRMLIIHFFVSKRHINTKSAVFFCADRYHFLSPLYFPYILPCRSSRQIITL